MKGTELVEGLSVEAMECVEHLKVVAGVDDDYLARWDARAWEAWATAARAWREQHRDACPVLPEWMRPACVPWENDFSVPFPAVAGLWPSGHDWFAEADAHEDFRLNAGFFGVPGMPSLEAIRAAWDWADSGGLEPTLSLSIVPDEPWDRPAVLGAIEGFAVHGASSEQISVLGKILGGGPRSRWPSDQPADYWDAAERHVAAWEWL